MVFGSIFFSLGKWAFGVKSSATRTGMSEMHPTTFTDHRQTRLNIIINVGSNFWIKLRFLVFSKWRQIFQWPENRLRNGFSDHSWKFKELPEEFRRPSQKSIPISVIGARIWQILGNNFAPWPPTCLKLHKWLHYGHIKLTHPAADVHHNRWKSTVLWAPPRRDNDHLQTNFIWGGA